jgi:hypothetical protein
MKVKLLKMFFVEKVTINVRRLTDNLSIHI